MSKVFSFAGSQGWPSVAYNPFLREYFAVFYVQSRAHFSGKSMILGQRIKADKTERAAFPALVIKGTDGGDENPVHIKYPSLIFNPATG